MAPVLSKLAASASSAAQQMAKFVHAIHSYRTVLSDEGFEDIAIEVTDAKPGEKTFDVNVLVYSKAAFAKSNKKDPIKFFLPEMAVNWSNMHTVGSVFKETSENIFGFKRRLIFQSKWEEGYDATINSFIQNLKDHVRPYDDINEEVHWVIQRLFKLDRMILKEIIRHENSCKTDGLRAKLLMEGRYRVARERGVDVSNVPSADPAVLDATVENFMNHNNKAKPIKISERLSVPDTCPAGADCLKDDCKNPEHIRGDKQYTITLTDKFFVQKKWEQNAPKPDAVPFTTVLSKWVELHPGKTATDASLPENKESLDKVLYDVALADGKWKYCPAFYRTRKYGTLDIPTKQAGEAYDAVKANPEDAAKKGIKAPMLYYPEPHPKIIKFGTTARVLCTISAGCCSGVQGGVGMRLKFNSSQITITRQQHLSYQALEADAVYGDEDIDIVPGDYVPEPTPSSSSSSSSSYSGVSSAMDVAASYSSSASFVEPTDETRKRKHDDDDSRDSKRARTGE